MIKRIVIALLVVTLWGCDDRESYLVENNVAPSINFTKGDVTVAELRDSVRMKAGNKVYCPIQLQLSSETSEIKKVQFEILQGSPKIEYRGTEVKDGRIPSEYATLVLKCVPTKPEPVKIKFIAVNRFGGTYETTATILFFESLPLKADFEVSKITDAGYLTYAINASKTASGAAKWGGFITQYTFNINGQDINSKSPTIHYVFPGEGSYNIKLTATDDDGLSSTIEKLITIKGDGSI